MKTVLGENLYSSAEVAELLGVTAQTVATYVRKNRLKAVKIGGKKYINEESLKSFLNPEQELPPTTILRYYRICGIIYRGLDILPSKKNMFLLFWSMVAQEK